MASITDFAPIRTRAATPTRTFWRAIVTAIKVMGERNRLAQLEDHQLADIGLERPQVSAMVNVKFDCISHQPHQQHAQIGQNIGNREDLRAQCLTP